MSGRTIKPAISSMPRRGNGKSGAAIGIDEHAAAPRLKGAHMEDLLRDFPVTVTVPVAWGDMDAFQHVNNTVYFRYFETARIAYFDKLDLMTQMAATGIGPILSHTQCRFKLPLTYPDTVTVGARVDDIKVDRFVMIYRAVSRRHEKVAAEGDGTLVAYHYGEGRKASVPDVLRKRIEDIENAAGA